MTAHPRSRGENHLSQPVPGRYHGSSPLTRGKHVVPKLGTRFSGLIPAHAGKTRSTAVHPIGRRAHPRSRGENALGVAICGVVTGSSPLTRGKRFCPPHVGRFVRLIPAHAGKTVLPASRRSVCPAHPRSRGENASIDAKAAELGGSSPLTRGKPLSVMACISVFRLIPAHAGKTLLVSRRWP